MGTGGGGGVHGQPIGGNGCRGVGFPVTKSGPFRLGCCCHAAPSSARETLLYQVTHCF